jgi:hypothetical protein
MKIDLCKSHAYLPLLQLDLVTEWSSNPVMISVETTDYPIQNIPFPAITICRKDNNPNRMQFTAKVLDFVQFPCFDDQ